MGKIRVKQAQQRAKRVFFTTVGRSGHQDEMPGRVGGELAQQLVSLVSATTTLIPKGTGMRLIHDYQLRASAGKLIAPPIRFDKVQRDDHMVIEFKQRLPDTAGAF